MTEETQDPTPPILGEVVAVGTVAVATNEPTLGALMEDAAIKAILDCYANGITDPKTILQAKLDAFEAVKAKYYGT